MLSLQWLRFNPWPRGLPQALNAAKKEKKKKKKKSKETPEGLTDKQSLTNRKTIDEYLHAHKESPLYRKSLPAQLPQSM